MKDWTVQADMAIKALHAVSDIKEGDIPYVYYLMLEEARNHLRHIANEIV